MPQISHSLLSDIDFSSWSEIDLMASYERNSRLLQHDGPDPFLMDMMGQLEEELRLRGVNPEEIIEDVVR